jgi:hypothetical protein
MGGMGWDAVVKGGKAIRNAWVGGRWVVDGGRGEDATRDAKGHARDARGFRGKKGGMQSDRCDATRAVDLFKGMRCSLNNGDEIPRYGGDECDESDQTSRTRRMGPRAMDRCESVRKKGGGGCRMRSRGHRKIQIHTDVGPRTNPLPLHPPCRMVHYHFGC